MKIWLLILIIPAFFLPACTKTNNAADPVPVPPVVTAPSMEIDIPLTKGSYWKYQRIDTTTISNIGRADTSIELMTLIGDTLLTDIDPVNKLAIWQINNLTKNTLDTNFIRYSKNSFFALFGHPSTQSSNFSYTILSLTIIDSMLKKYKTTFRPGWEYYIQFALPVSPATINQPTNLPGETYYAAIDTTLSLPAATYTGNAFVGRNQFTMGAGQSQIGGGSNQYRYFFKPGVGIIFIRQAPYTVFGPSVGCCTAPFSTWYTRKLIDYKIK